jgi:hypothetical protein
MQQKADAAGEGGSKAFGVPHAHAVCVKDGVEVEEGVAHAVPYERLELRVRNALVRTTQPAGCLRISSGIPAASRSSHHGFALGTGACSERLP